MNEPQPAAFEASTTFRSKVQSKSAQIGVIGLGYVGLPLGLLFARNGFPTTGFDIDQAKVEMLAKGESYIRHIPGSAIAEQAEKKGFRATSDFAVLKEMDAILICVPTPLEQHHEPNLSFVCRTTEAIARYLRPGQLVVLESTKRWFYACLRSRG
jgi:UDP-N-acetyl-D-glucosamine dehydrogenase